MRVRLASLLVIVVAVGYPSSTVAQNPMDLSGVRWRDGWSVIAPADSLDSPTQAQLAQPSMSSSRATEADTTLLEADWSQIKLGIFLTATAGLVLTYLIASNDGNHPRCEYAYECRDGDFSTAIASGRSTALVSTVGVRP